MGQFFLILGSILAATPAFAMDSTETLPASVNSPALRYGIVSGVDSRYAANGAVQTLNDINTIHFDSNQLKKVSPDITTLVLVLNQLSGNRRLGDQLDLGTVRVETQPDVHYLAPIYARGITDDVSVAVAAPVVLYKNKLRIVQSNSNAGQICDQIGPTPSQDLASACTKIRNTQMTSEVANQLAAKGYKPIVDRSETVFGDLEVVGLWRFFNDGDLSAMLRTTVTLPSGHPKDPDDLAALSIFGETAVEPMLYFNSVLWQRLRLSTKAGYRYAVPDHVGIRVPNGDDDLIPDASSSDNVSRKLGDAVTLGAAATWNLIGAFSLAAGYEYVVKGADRYSGARGGRYDLLGKDTESSAHNLRAAISWDSIALYKRTKTFPPLKVDFEVANTVAGKNVDREIVNELSLSLFF